MPINLPVPHDIEHRSLYQFLSDILRRAIDGSINPAVVNVGVKVVGNDITISTAGNGLVLTSRDGLHTYRLVMDNDGAISSDQLT